MPRLMAIRLLGGIATLLAASVLIFATVEFLPGDAASAYLGRDATPTAAAKLRKEFGLDRPITQRYADWIWSVMHGDLGKSPANGVKVSTLIGTRLGNSAVLVGITLLLLIPLSLVVGTVAALRRGSPIDTAIQLATLATVALPEFVVGIAFILAFAFIWRLLPAVSFELSLRTLILPVATLLVVSFAYTARMVRAGVVGVLDQEFVDMARMKGLPERLVIRRHVLPNSLVPSVQAFALTAAWMPGGIIIIESLFGFPGMGVGLVQAVSARDTPTVEALTLIVATVYVIANLLSDIFTVLATPRLRTQLA
ncbi:MAG: peptide/nickel transport system permease protein [Gaiellaceae bacterium]|jgi:peptide/nickel transport system permease protein|nr:peptide/nickel transport system permease protein [Gaiellaceae bacterium]